MAYSTALIGLWLGIVAAAAHPSYAQSGCGFNATGFCPCAVVDYDSCARPTDSPGTQLFCEAVPCDGYVCLCDGDPGATHVCEGRQETVYTFDVPNDDGVEECTATSALIPVPISEQPARAPLLREVYSSPNAQFTDAVRTGVAGDDRLFVTQQDGTVIVLDGATYEVISDAFLVLSVTGSGERGLLGIAFHPNFAQNGYFYVNYVPSGTSDTVVSRFTVSAEDPNQADAASELMILRTEQPFSNHNGGQIRFQRNTGLLLIALGDGGSGNDPLCSGQDTSTALGSILRIDVDSPQAPLNYGVPPSNPLVGTSGARGELWVWGLRNPWRFSEDSTGAVWIGDVGQGSREEIDVVPGSSPNGGLNFGWLPLEGTLCLSFASETCANNGVTVADCDSDSYTPPVYEYTHADGCSVSGGAVYEREDGVSELYGKYVFADFCTNVLWMLEEGEGGALVRRDVPLTDGSDGYDSNIVFITAVEDPAGPANAPFFVGTRSQLFVLMGAP